MLANVRASQDPARPATVSGRTTLPEARAFRGNNLEGTVHDALSLCKRGGAACSFTIHPWATRPYFDAAQVVGDASANCGRHAIGDRRTVTVELPGHNNLVGRAELAKEEYKPLRELVGDGFEHYAGHSWSWDGGRSRNVAWNVEPGEVSWIELQAARERAEGLFTQLVDENSRTDHEAGRYRLFAAFDTPSRGRSDRLYQRSGPLTPDASAACAKLRPTEAALLLTVPAPEAGSPARTSVLLIPRRH